MSAEIFSQQGVKKKTHVIDRKRTRDCDFSVVSTGLCQQIDVLVCLIAKTLLYLEFFNLFYCFETTEVWELGDIKHFPDLECHMTSFFQSQGSTSHVTERFPTNRRLTETKMRECRLVYRLKLSLFRECYEKAWIWYTEKTIWKLVFKTV